MILVPPFPRHTAATCCPVCDSQRTDAALLLHDWAYTGEGPFSYARCQDCGAIYATQELAPSALGSFYPPHYAAYVNDAAPGSLRGRASRLGLAKRCRTVEHLRQGGRLLDVGCGAGAFLNAMQARGGWDVVGLERDRQAAEAAHRRGLDVHRGEIETYEFAPGTFDVITLWDVVEHLDRPVDTLCRISSWLAPDGWLVMRTPDAACRQARWFGDRWAGYDAPRHRIIYSWNALERLVRRCGLALRSVVGPRGSSALASLSMCNLVLARGWPRWLAQAQVHPLTQAAWVPGCAIWEAARGGAELVVAARRPGETNHPNG